MAGPDWNVGAEKFTLYITENPLLALQAAAARQNYNIESANCVPSIFTHTLSLCLCKILANFYFPKRKVFRSLVHVRTKAKGS